MKTLVFHLIQSFFRHHPWPGSMLTCREGKVVVVIWSALSNFMHPDALCGFWLLQCGDEGVRSKRQSYLPATIVTMADVQILALHRPHDPPSTSNQSSLYHLRNLMLPNLGPNPEPLSPFIICLAQHFPQIWQEGISPGPHPSEDPTLTFWI